MFKKKYIGFCIRTYPYTYNGEKKIGYVIYHKFLLLGCLCYDRISICPDIDWLNESKFLLGIN